MAEATTPSMSRSVRFAVCAAAALGFAFDIYELLMLPLIVRPALAELAGIQPGTPEFARWVGLLFYVPALCGGVFGLLGGYLTDRLGRRRVLVWSILIYAVSALLAGFATSPLQLLVLRCTTFIGVCVEFVAAVAWLAELFPEPKRREAVLGYTQAFSSLGGLMVAGAYFLAVRYGDAFPAIHGGHEAWRYTLISGVIPAILLAVVRPFLPESPVWQRLRSEGKLQRPSIAQLFRPEFRRTTLVTTLLVACGYGAAFGAIQQLPQIVPGLPEVAELARPAQQETVSGVQSWQEMGGLLGRILLAVLAVRIVGRRRLLWLFQVPGLFVVPWVFFVAARSDLDMLKWGIFFAGLLTVAQFSFWGNYLPRVFPTYLRGTGESFAANVGGRMIGTSMALVSTRLALEMPGDTPAARAAFAAGVVALAVYAIACVATRWLPEPPREELPG